MNVVKQARDETMRGLCACRTKQFAGGVIAAPP
jgi:hypothetical protein